MRRLPVLPAPMLVVASACSVQSGAALAVRLFGTAGPGGTVELRLLLSGVVLAGFTRPRLRGRPAAELRLIAGYGAVMAAMNASFYLALDRIPIGAAVTIELVGPLTVAVVGSRRRRDLLWVALAAAGVVLLGVAEGSNDLAGIGLAAVAASMWAAYIVLAARVGRLAAGQDDLALALLLGALLLAPYGVVDGGRALLRPHVLVRGSGVALLSSLIPYSLELRALRRIRPAVFGVMMSIEPAVAALSGWVFLGQHLHLSAWLALVCVTGASAGAVGTGSTAAPVVPAEPETVTVVS